MDSAPVSVLFSFFFFFKKCINLWKNTHHIILLSSQNAALVATRNLLNKYHHNQRKKSSVAIGIQPGVCSVCAPAYPCSWFWSEGCPGCLHHGHRWRRRCPDHGLDSVGEDTETGGGKGERERENLWWRCWGLFSEPLSQPCPLEGRFEPNHHQTTYFFLVF